MAIVILLSVPCTFPPSGLLAVAQVFEVRLTSNGDSGHSCIVPDLKRKDF